MKDFCLSATTLTYTSTVFNTAWRGALPIATHGPDNTAGSTRTINYSTAVGTYAITEVVSVRPYLLISSVKAR